MSATPESDDTLPLSIKLLMLLAFLVIVYVLVVDVAGFVDIIGSLGPPLV